MEDRGQVLVLAAAHTQLELAAAIVAYAALEAVVIGIQQVAQAAQARRLDVDHARGVGQRLDVLDRMDVGIPREASPVRLEHRVSLWRQLGILDPRLWESLHDTAVEHWVRS